MKEGDKLDVSRHKTPFKNESIRMQYAMAAAFYEKDLFMSYYTANSRQSQVRGIRLRRKYSHSSPDKRACEMRVE